MRYDFNPLPPHGGRLTDYYDTYSDKEDFNPLPPHGGRLKEIYDTRVALKISIHSLRMEGDQGSSRYTAPSPHFNPLPPHGGRPSGILTMTIPHCISIHSLRMEGDIQRLGKSPEPRNISIHSLRMEGDGGGDREILFEMTLFQSTPSAWRETSGTCDSQQDRLDFNPLPPHGGRHSAIFPVLP